MKKALMLASVASMIDQFNMENIKILQDLGYEVHVIANFSFGNTTSEERIIEFKKELEEKNIKVFNVPIPRKITSLKEMAKSYKEIKEICEENNYKILHCHSPIGGVLARLAFRKERKKGNKLIYTAHGFHFYKGAPLSNWIIFYPIERFCARFTDTLITINKEDYKRAKNFKAKNVEYVPGIGIDTKAIREIQVDRESKLKEFNIKKNEIVIISVGELSSNKNQEVIIKAISKINQPLKYILCGQGPLEGKLRNLAKELGIENKVIFAGYRSDVKELLKVSDIFCFPSKREGLSVALMEAMASGLPVVCSNIRGNLDLIEDGKGGYLVSYNDVEGFYKKIVYLIENKELMKKYKEFNLYEILHYDVKKVKRLTEKIYGD